MTDPIVADVNASGIYQIRNILSGKRYIGSAKCFRIRWTSHRAKLGHGKHHSRHLQASWNKHGAEAFAFEILELCEPSELLVREQRWLDKRRPEFNVCRTAGNTLGVKFSQETKAKIAAKARGRKMPPRSAEHRAKISLASKGRALSEEAIAKMKESKRLNPQEFTEKRRLMVSESLKSQYASGARSRERSPEYRQKIAETLRGRTIPPEVRERSGPLCVASKEALRDRCAWTKERRCAVFRTTKLCKF
jgi:group I intron endonuclease